jgi:tripartite ATP-independent transporter DctM subunit
MQLLLFVLIVGLAGAPVFAVMGGATQLAWLLHPNPAMHHVRFLAADVLDERFAGSPILVTVPLFTFVGYVLAESQAPARIVRASEAFFGWLPGGLAIVCIIASAFFTTLTGGSAVTIIAVGGLLYPALLSRGYPKNYALGLVMTGGSLGLLLPPSLPILLYSLVAGIDFTKAFKASLLPGLFIMLALAVHAVYTGLKHRLPRSRPNAREMTSALWEIKWELGIPVLIFGSLGTGLADIDEASALAAAYVLAVELLIHKHLTRGDLPRLCSNAMALAGALLLIIMMALALTNYLVTEQIPNRLFDTVTELGVTSRWQFLIALNACMWVLGALMEGISAIFVAVPLLIPFGAAFGLSPFHLAMMFLLNLEIAFLSPPFGQNLFVTSFRFNQPMASLYRVAMPFLAILIACLVLIMYVPGLSTLGVRTEIARLKAKARQAHEPAREAWLLECVQEDLNDPQPCTEEEKRSASKRDPAPEPRDRTPQPERGVETAGDTESELFEEMVRE